jgi:hypothetical protein
VEMRSSGEQFQHVGGNLSEGKEGRMERGSGGIEGVSCGCRLLLG